MLVRLAVAIALVAAQLALPAAAFIHVNPGTSPVAQLVDDAGRTRLFHGVNVVYKIPPYLPDSGNFTVDTSLGPADISFLREHGLNVVRLYVAWPGVNPTASRISATYLDAVAAIVDSLAAADIYTVLDCHQDTLSPKFCGEGLPDDAVPTDLGARPFPEPVAPAFALNATTGYPSPADCAKHPFFVYTLADAVCKTFQALYDNHDGMRDRFVDFWRAVATRFANSSHVLGYEIINEPWAGDIYSNKKLLMPHFSDRLNLQPLYELVHSAIRSVDDAHIILFEPTVATTALPIPGFARSGFTQGPGGPAYNDRQVLAYHDYCQLLTPDGQPLAAKPCSLLDDKTFFPTRMADLRALGVAGFITEWGALNNGTATDAAYAHAFLGHADAHLQSWIYWSFKSYHDITTQAREPDGAVREGLWLSNGTLDVAKLKLLAYTYPQAVAGTLRNFSFDWATASAVFSFAADPTATAPTVLFADSNLYYNGAAPQITTTPANSVAVTAGPGPNQWSLHLAPSVRAGDLITVMVSQPGDAS